MKKLLALLFVTFTTNAQTPTTIGNLPAATTLTGSEAMPCEQGGTKKCTVAQITTQTTSTLAPSATVDTTNAYNITKGILPCIVLPPYTGVIVTSGCASSFASTTGTGATVLATSPTLVTPALGTPSSVTLTHGTGLPITGVTGLGTGVGTALGVNVGSAGAPVVNGGALGTPSSGSAANLTGFPTLNQNTTGTASNITGTSNSTLVTLSALSLPSSQVTGLSTPAFSGLASGTNTAAAMLVGTGASLATTGSGTLTATNTTGVNGAAVPASACAVSTNGSSQLTALTCTGSGNSVKATSPTLTTPNLGTPSAITLTSGTGLPISTGVSGLGTGIATALAVNAGTAGAPVINGGALGTPSSGSAANLTGFPTFNQNTTGTAANITGTSNATLTTLSALSLPSTQVSGLGTFATQSYATPPAIGGTTPAAGAFTTLSASSGSFTSSASGVTVGSPTGGAEGAGTLNMAGCYVNGVACGTAPAFNGITSGTNTSAAMLVGTGSSLAPTGSGTITASGLNSTALGAANTWSGLQTFGTNISIGGVTAAGATGTGNAVFATSPTLTTPNLGTPSAITLTNGTGLPVAGVTGLGTFATQNYATPPAIGGTTPAAGTFTTLGATGSLTTNVTGSTQCLHANTSGVVSGTGSDCVAPIFSNITSGTNTSATMTLGSGSTLTFSGSGINNANEINGTALSGLASGLVLNTTATGVPSIASIGSGLGLTSGTLSTTYTIRSVSGTTDTILSSDCGNAVKYTSSGAVAVALPQATGSFAACRVNILAGGSGVITVTPITSTLNGGTYLNFLPGTSASIVALSGNYTASGPAVSNTWANVCAFAANPSRCGSTIKELGAVRCTASSKTVTITESLPASYVGAAFALTGCGPLGAQAALGGYVPANGGTGYVAKSPTVNPTSYTVTGITQAASMVATISTVSTVNPFAGIPAATFASVAGMTQVNNVTYPISATGGSSGAWTVTFALINSTTFPAYTSGGTLTPSLYTGDILTVLGGTCTVQPLIEPLTVSATGVIQTFAVVTPGACTASPGAAAATSGGTGSGATVTLNYQGAGINDIIASVGTNSVTMTTNAAAVSVTSGNNWWEAGWDDSAAINAAVASGASYAYLPVTTVAPWSATAFPQYGITSPIGMPITNSFRLDCASQFINALAPMRSEITQVNTGAFSTSNPGSGNGYNNCRWDGFGLASINDDVEAGALKSNNNIYMNATVANIFLYNIPATVQRVQYTASWIHNDPLFLSANSPAPTEGLWVMAGNTDDEFTTFITDGTQSSAYRADAADVTLTDWHSFSNYDGPTADSEATKTTMNRWTVDRPAPGQPAYYLNATLTQLDVFNAWITAGQWNGQYGVYINNANGSNSIGCGNFGLVANWTSPQNEVVVVGAAGGVGANNSNTIAWSCISGGVGLPLQFTGGTYGSSPAYGFGINSLHSNPPSFVDAFTAASATVPARYEFDFPSPIIGTSNTGITYTADYLLHLRVPTCTGGTNTPTCGTIGSLLTDGVITSNGGMVTNTLSASSTVSGAGFSTYLASPPSIGATTPAAGKFTTLATTGLYTPTSTIGIKGTTAGDTVQAGSVGELMVVNCPVNNTSAAVTFTTASPTVVNWASAPWVITGPTNWTCAINFTGTLPTGIAAATTYYIAGASYNSGTGNFNIASTVALAIANTPDVNVTVAGTPPYTGIMGAYSIGTTGVVAGAAIQLTAGDWDCGGQAEFNVTTTATTTTAYQGGLINGSTFGSDSGKSTTIHQTSGSIASGTNSSIAMPIYNDDTNGNLTLQLLDNWNSGAGVINMGGLARCRRIR